MKELSELLHSSYDVEQISRTQETIARNRAAAGKVTEPVKGTL